MPANQCHQSNSNMCQNAPPPAATEKLYQWDYCVTKCKFNRRAEGADGVGFGVQYPGAKVASSE